MFDYNDDDDTIIAQTTPAGNGAVALIRLSGSRAVEVTDEFFKGKRKLADAPTHSISYGFFCDKQGLEIDDVLVSLFITPTSYTGEDSVELSCHGSQFIVQRIIAVFIGAGIRMAEPGEFTKRAFLNGRLDLTQAEAVGDLINASTESSRRGARNQLDGMLSSRVNSMREKLTEMSALLELELDFAEEDISFASYQELIKKVESFIVEIDVLLESYRFGKIAKDGVEVVFAGRSNVGKSSLLNYFLKEERAIVTHIPGTTRDVIKEDMTIDGFLFRLSDTAGIRDSDDLVEQIGIKRSHEAIENADLVICVGDIEQGIDDSLQELLKIKSRERIITVVNKIDVAKESDLPESDVAISALTGEGVGELIMLMKDKAIGSWDYTERSAVVTNLRHKNMLENTKKFLLEAINGLKRNDSNEFIALEFREALESMGEIVGAITSEDLLNKIFSDFCIGK